MLIEWSPIFLAAVPGAIALAIRIYEILASRMVSEATTVDLYAEAAKHQVENMQSLWDRMDSIEARLADCEITKAECLEELHQLNQKMNYVDQTVSSLHNQLNGEPI